MLVCRSDYAYGDRGHGQIPPKATLEFDLELMHIQRSQPPHRSPPSVTNYFPIYFKNYAVQYGDKFFTAAIRSASIVEQSSDLCWLCSQKVVVYNIEVIRGRHTWTIQRRYRELLAFYKKAQCTYLEFPPKTYFPQYHSSFLQERIRVLNAFIEAYLQSETSEGRLQNNHLVAEFFELHRPR